MGQLLCLKENLWWTSIVHPDSCFGLMNTMVPEFDNGHAFPIELPLVSRDECKSIYVKDQKHTCLVRAVKGEQFCHLKCDDSQLVALGISCAFGHGSRNGDTTRYQSKLIQHVQFYVTKKPSNVSCTAFEYQQKPYCFDLFRMVYRVPETHI